MGSHTFRWEHPADEVHVTGTFDNWSKSVKLDKKDLVHEKTVALPKSDEKILYKFVADGEWKHDHTAKTETDHEGNVNNVLYPDDIKPPNSQAHSIPSVAAGAAGLGAAGLGAAGLGAASSTKMADAGQSSEKSLPGAFPDEEDQNVSVNPIPASEGAGNPVNLAPGEKVPDPSTINSNTVGSTVHDDPELKSQDQQGGQTFGVAPIPATGGIGNPVNLKPGEKVPDSSTLTGNTVDSTVKTDQASYEKSDASAPSNPVGSSVPQTSFGGPPTLAGAVIPESGLPMGKDMPADISKEDVGSPNISSVGPQSSSAALAGQQPIEPRGTPQVEKEGGEDPTISSVGPTASTTGLAGQQPIEPRGEAQVEKDASGEKEGSGHGKEAAIASAVGIGGVGAAGAAGLGALSSKDKDEKPTSTASDLHPGGKDFPNTSQSSGDPMISSVGPDASTTALAGKQPIESGGESHPEKDGSSKEDGTGDEGKGSSGRYTGAAIASALGGGLAWVGAAGAARYEAWRHPTDHANAKDSADTAAQGTDPTISSVGPDSSTSQLAGKQPIEDGSKGADTDPTISSVAPGASTTGLAGAQPLESQAKGGETDPNISSVGPGASTTGLAAEQPKESGGVPEVVSESQKDAGVEPEASANPTAVGEKKDVEDELQKKVPEESSTSESGTFGKSEGGLSGKAVAGIAAGGVGAAGAAVAANEFIKDKTNRDPAGALPQSAQDTLNEKAKDSSLPEQATGRTADPTQEIADTSGEATKSEDTTSKPTEDAKKDDGGISGAAAGGIAGAGVGAAGGAVAANEFLKDKTGTDPAGALPQSAQDKLNENAKESSLPQQTTETSQPTQPAGTTNVINQSSKEEVGTDGLGKSELSNDKPTTDNSTTSDPTKDKSDTGAKVAAGVAGAGVATAGGAVAANELLKDKTGTDPAGALPQSAQDTLNKSAEESSLPSQAVGQTAGATDGATSSGSKVMSMSQWENQEDAAAGSAAPTTSATAAGAASSAAPEEVTKSQQEAGYGAEAAANPEAVEEKSAVEKELLSKVPTSEAKGEPAPTESAATTEAAPTSTSASGAPQLGDPVAGVAPISMGDDKAAAAPSDGLNASKDSEAQPPAAKAATAEDSAVSPAEPSKPGETDKLGSRDISPMSKSQTQPTATSGVAAAAIPRKNGASSSTPQKRQSIIDKLKGTPESSKTTGTAGTADTAGTGASTDKKAKRRSFFGKLKDKLKS